MGAVKQAVKKVAEEDDLFVSTAVEVSLMDADTALAQALESNNGVGMNYFRLGGILDAIYRNKWWEQSHESFESLVEAEFGFRKRKAAYLISTYTNLVNSEVPWATLQHLPWSKIRLLAIVLTQENADEWVARAEKLNSQELAEAIAESKSGSMDSNESEVESEPVASRTFKGHADQMETIDLAVEKAMGECDTEFKTVALEAICMNYLSGPSLSKL